MKTQEEITLVFTGHTWSSLNNISQNGFEELSCFDKWLEPTQERVFEYEG